MLYRISNKDKVKRHLKFDFFVLIVWNISVLFLKITLFWKDYKTSNVMITNVIIVLKKFEKYKVYNNFAFILFNKTFSSFNLKTLMRSCVHFHSREKTPSDVNSWPGGEEKYKRTHWDTGSKCYLPYCLCSVKLFIACH